jgi:nucleoside-diphosphate-sugar epimerase
MSNKIVTVLGGSGFVGKQCIYRLLKTTDYSVISISRSGALDFSGYKDLTSVEKQRLINIKGSALNENDVSESLQKSFAVIHSIGTLISFAPKEDQRSYNKLIYETAKIASDVLKKGSSEKVNFVYISAERGLPFPLSLKFGGYIESKRKAESELFANEKINPYILRPGVIVDKTHRLWSVPLGVGVNIINSIETKLGLTIGEILNFPSQATQLDVLSKFAVDGCMGKLNKNIYSAYELI